METREAKVVTGTAAVAMGTVAVATRAETEPAATAAVTGWQRGRRQQGSKRARPVLAVWW